MGNKCCVSVKTDELILFPPAQDPTIVFKDLLSMSNIGTTHNTE